MHFVQPPASESVQADSVLAGWSAQLWRARQPRWLFRHSAKPLPHSPRVVGGVMRHFILGTAMASLVVVFATCSRSTSNASGSQRLARVQPHWEGGIRPMQPRTGAAEPTTPAALFEG